MLVVTCTFKYLIAVKFSQDFVYTFTKKTSKYLEWSKIMKKKNEIDDFFLYLDNSRHFAIQMTRKNGNHHNWICTPYTQENNLFCCCSYLPWLWYSLMFLLCLVPKFLKFSIHSAVEATPKVIYHYNYWGVAHDLEGTVFFPILDYQRFSCILSAYLNRRMKRKYEPAVRMICIYQKKSERKIDY